MFSNIRHAPSYLFSYSTSKNFPAPCGARCDRSRPSACPFRTGCKDNYNSQNPQAFPEINPAEKTFSHVPPTRSLPCLYVWVCKGKPKKRNRKFFQKKNWRI